jgi:hypothetical protein
MVLVGLQNTAFARLLLAALVLTHAAPPALLSELKGALLPEASAGTVQRARSVSAPDRREPVEARGLLARMAQSLTPEPAWAEEKPPRKLRPMEQRRAKTTLKHLLAKVPVFMVTNAGGSPFLNQLSSGDQSALMFLFPAEAQKMLQGVLKAPNGASSGAQVFTTNLDRALTLARQPPMNSGLRDRVSNRELTMVWQFKPHDDEARAAQLVEAKRGKRAPSMPAYYVDGLVVKHGGKEVRPLYLSKRDCDAAVEKLGGEKPKVAVHDLLGTLLNLAEGVERGDAQAAREIAQIELVPPSESVALRDEIQGKKKKRPPKMVRR